MLEAFVWNPDTVALQVGPLAVRWYALCWGIGLILAYFVVLKLYKQQRIPDEKFDPLLFYCFVGILLGARLGHCLFYEPGYFLSHPIEMLLPIRHLPEGGWRYTGYAGLASHGGTLGLMLALWLYVRKTKVNLMRVLDNIAIATPITACCIRLGNFMNSEIVGKPTPDGSPFGVVFAHNGEAFARYPGQLFEAMAYFVFFFIGLALYAHFRRNDAERRNRFYAKLKAGADAVLPRDARVGTGFYFGFCLTSIFLFRFFVEFLKEVQEPWEKSMVELIGLNQGQLLSIPFVILGLYCLFGGRLCRKLGEA